MKPNNRFGESSTSRPVMGDVAAPAKLTEVSSDLEPKVIGETLDSSYTPPPPKKRQIWHRSVGLSLLGVGLLGAVLLVLHTVSTNRHSSMNATPVDMSAQLKPQTIPLSDLGLQPINLLPETNQITVNGSVNIADSLVLSPTATPAGAVAGQLYYDQTRNQLAYYNGTSFVYMLQPSNGASVTNNSVTNNVTNVANNITNNNGTTNGLTASGASAGDIAMFTSGTTLGSSLINQNGSTVNVAGNFEINGTPLSSSTLSDNANLAKLNATQTFTGANTFANTANSTTAFVIQDANGNALWTADTTNRVLTAGGNLIVNTPSSCNYNSYVNYMGGLHAMGYWKLDDNGVSAADSSGSGNTGTLANVTTGITPGPISCGSTHAGMSFNGNNSTITTANSAPNPNTYTEMAMFKTSGTLGTFMGFTNFAGNHDREFGIDNTGKLYAEIWNNTFGNQAVTSPGPVNDGNWHMAVVTVSGAGMYLYLDGTLVASNASYTTPQTYSGSVLMGGEWGVSGAPYLGDLAQAAVIPSALSSLQIQTLAADSGFYNANLAALGIGTVTPGANLDDAGTALFHDANNEPTAFQVQNKQGNNLLSVDTAGNTVNVGATGSTPLSSTVNVGTSTDTNSNQTVNVGSGTSSSTTTVQGGTGGVNMNTGAVNGTSGSISIESGASSTTAAGNVYIDTGSSVINGTVVENKTFEDGIDDMGDGFGRSDTIATTTAQAHSGSNSLSITEGPFWGNWAIGEGAQYPTNTIIPGHTYRFSAWVRAATTSRSITFDVDWSNDGYAGGGTVLDQVWGTVTDSTSGWTQVTGTLVAPLGAYYIGIGAASNAGTTGEVHYLDDITVTDLNQLTATAELNLGTTNAQEVNVGNANQTGATSIYGTGLNLVAGLGYITASGGYFNIGGTQGGSISTGNGGPLNLTSGGSASISANGGALSLSGAGGGYGGVTVKPGADTTTDFNVQSSTGTNLLNVDSVNTVVSLGGNVSTYGYETVAANQGTGNSEWLEAQKFTTTNGGTLKSITAYFGAADSAPNNKFAVALYSDSGSACNGGAALTSCPATMIASSANTTITSYTWNVASITATLAPNTSYWMVLNTYASAGNLNNTYFDTNPSYDYASDSGVALGSWPAFGAPTFTGHSATSMYASAVTGADGSSLTTNADGQVTIGSGNGNTSYELTVNSPGPGTGALFVQGSTTISADNPYALFVAPAGGGEMFDVDTQNNRVLIGGLDTHWGGPYTSGTLDVRAEPHLGAVSVTDAGGNGLFYIGGDGSTQITTQTNSTTGLLVQNSSFASIFNVDTANSITTVTNFVATGTVTLEGHLITSGSTPTHTAGTDCSSPTITVNGNDTSGTITVATGGSCTSAGALATISFASAYASAPHVVITPGAANAAGLNAYVDDSSITANGFVLGTSVTPAAGTTYQWNYFVVQ